MRRVVVSGLGLLSPLGHSVKESWSNLIEGRSGIRKVPALVEAQKKNDLYRVVIGGDVKNFSPENHGISRLEQKRMAQFIQFAMAATREAWLDSNLPEKLEGKLSERAGAIFGVGILGIENFIHNYDVLREKGPKRVSPYFIPSTVANLAPGNVAMKYNLKGSNWALVSACASSTHAIGEAMLAIRDGRHDIMVSGGCESALIPLAISGFDAMHALCRKWQDEPTLASRPFDRDRDGFVMAEGAGVLILEDLDHATKRGAKIYAEITGYGSSCDAFHLTAPVKNGEGAQRAMQQAISMSGKSLKNFQCINAHGTSTIFNDRTETEAIKAVFKGHSGGLSVTANKSMTGHMLGAAGAAEAIFSVLSLKNQVVPATLNCDNADEICNLDYTANRAVFRPIKNLLSNSFGFGGTNACLAIGQNDDLE